MAKYAKFFSVGGGAGPNGLQLPLGTVLDATLRQVQDGTGTGSPLYLSTGSVRIGTTAGSAMYWDNTNNRLGIGTNTPTATTHIVGTGNSSATTAFIVQNSVGAEALKITDNSAITIKSNITNILANSLSAPTGGSELMFNLVGNGQGMSITNQFGTTYRIGQYQAANVFSIGVSGSAAFNINTSNNIGIGLTNPTARTHIQGSGSTGATSSLLVQNSAGTTALEVFDSLTVRSDNSQLFFPNNLVQHRLGLMTFTNNSISCLSTLNIGGNTATTFTNTSLSFQTSTTFNAMASPNNATRTGISIIGDFTNAGAGINSVGNNFNITTALNTSVGNVTLNQFNITNTINTTGGTTLQRGFYYNPTLTSTTGFTHRAIETTTGDVLFGTTSGKATFGSGVAGTSYIEIKPGIGNGNNRITFNDFDGGTSTRGGFIEISTYLAQINFGSYNPFYLGDSSKPYNFYKVAGSSNIIISTGYVIPTDSGALFQVKGTGSTSATTSLLVQNSGGNTALQVTDDRTTTTSGTLTNLTTTAVLANGLGLTASSMGSYTSTAIYKTGGGEGQIDIAHYNAYTSNGLTIREFFGTGQNLYTLATKFELRILGGFSTSNGNNTVGNTLWMEPIYNITGQTGTILRGIYYNPTLTSLTGTTHYGIQTTSGGAYINTTTPLL